MAEYIETPMAPILLTPGLRLVATGTTNDGQMWLKFVNSGAGRLREVAVFVAATTFSYHYAIRDPKTDTIIAYEGPYGDPAKDESFLYGSR